MGTKIAESFANIVMAKIETTLTQQSETKPKAGADPAFFEIGGRTRILISAR